MLSSLQAAWVDRELGIVQTFSNHMHIHLSFIKSMFDKIFCPCDMKYFN